MKTPTQFRPPKTQTVDKNPILAAQRAMNTAKKLEQDLENMLIESELEGVSITVNGIGRPLDLFIDPAIVDESNVPELSQKILNCLTEAFNEAIKIRDSKLETLYKQAPHLENM